MPNPKVDLLYNEVSKKYNVGTLDEFSEKLNNPEKRKVFYDTVGKEYNLGTYDQFQSKVTVAAQAPSPINGYSWDPAAEQAKNTLTSIKAVPTYSGSVPTTTDQAVIDNKKDLNKKKVQSEMLYKSISGQLENTKKHLDALTAASSYGRKEDYDRLVAEGGDYKTTYGNYVALNNAAKTYVNDYQKNASELDKLVPKSYIEGTGKAVLEGTAKLYDALEGATQFLSDYTGLPHYPIYKKMADMSRNNTLSDMPEGIAGEILAGVGGTVPLLLTAPFAELRLSALGKTVSLPKFGLALGASSAGQAYEKTGDITEAAKEGGRGFVEGTVMEALGYPAGQVSRLVSDLGAGKILSESSGAIASGLTFGGYDATKKYLETGEFDPHAFLTGFGTGAAFHLPAMVSSAYKSATDKFFTSSPEVIREANLVEKPIEQIRQDAISIMEKIPSIKDSEQKKAEYIKASTLNTVADLKAITNQIRADHLGFMDAISNDKTISPEQKATYIDHMNEVLKQNDDRFKEASTLSYDIDNLKFSLGSIEKHPWSDANMQKAAVEGLKKRIGQGEAKLQAVLNRPFKIEKQSTAAEQPASALEEAPMPTKEISGEQEGSPAESMAEKPAAEVKVNPPSAEPETKLNERHAEFNDFLAKKFPNRGFNEVGHVKASEKSDALAEFLSTKENRKISGELEINSTDFMHNYEVHIGGKRFRMASRDYMPNYSKEDLSRPGRKKVVVELIRPTDKESLSNIEGNYKINKDGNFTFPDSSNPNHEYPYILQARHLRGGDFVGNLAISDFTKSRQARPAMKAAEKVTAAKNEFQIKDKGNDYKFIKDEFGGMNVEVNGVRLNKKDVPKAVKNVYEKHFDYSEGKRIEDADIPVTADTEEVYRYIRDNSENPLQIIETYKQAQSEMAGADPIREAIYKSLPKGNDINFESYANAGNRKNVIGSSMLKDYLSKDGRVTIDNIVEKVNAELGVNEGEAGSVGPNDIVDFLERNTRRSLDKEMKLKETPIMKGLAEAFKTLTGFDLTDEIANRALRQREAAARSEFQGMKEATYLKSEEAASRPAKKMSDLDVRIQQKMAELRERNKGKLRSGPGLENLDIYTELAYLHIKKGIRTVAEFAKEIGVQVDDAVRKAWADAVARYQKEFPEKKKSKSEKAQDTFTKWRRAILLSGISTLGKLTSAATARGLITPIEEIVGKGLAALPFVKDISAKAPREGGFNKYAEANAFAQWFSKATFKDAWETLKTGKGELDRQYGKLGNEEQTWLDFFGNLHSALKVGAKRAEFARAVEKRTSWAIDNGLDVNNHLVQMGIGADSYEDALRAIFMQDNKVVNAYQGKIDNLDKGGTKPIATVFKTLLPIVKVPTNFVAEQSSYAVGGLKAMAKIFDKSVEDLTPDQADYIIRALKKQSVGAAVLALGYFASDKIGGYYQNPGDEKKKKIKSGDVEVAGVKVPHLFLHNPLLDMLQMGATAHKVLKKRSNTALQAAETAFFGAVKQIPFVDEPIRLGKALESTRSFDYFLGELIKSFVIPPDIEKIAKKLDENSKGETKKRSPGNPLEHIEAAIPGLRQNVPLKKKSGGSKQKNF